jgi:hypothetical protein
MKKIRLLAIMFIITTLFFPSTFSVDSSSVNDTNNQYQLEALINSDLNIDLKARVSGGEWQDISLTVDNGGQIEFKLTLSSSGGGILVVLLFPSINEEPMMQYQLLSASHTPEIIDESFLMWGFVSNAPDTITFKANLLRTGTGSVDTSICNVPTQETRDDTVQIISQGGCCFPAGTKITMADGSIKFVEDITLGDRVLSYDSLEGKFSSWAVKMLGRPAHPVYSINDDLLKLTADHPIFIKKINGKMGLGAIDVNKAKDSITFSKEVLDVCQGDFLFTENGEWIKITSIEKQNEYVQTYNILSFSGTKTFFANGILVFEEHPPNSFTSPILERILEKMPRLTQFLFSTQLFNRLFAP